MTQQFFDGVIEGMARASVCIFAMTGALFFVLMILGSANVIDFKMCVTKAGACTMTTSKTERAA